MRLAGVGELSARSGIDPTGKLSVESWVHEACRGPKPCRHRRHYPPGKLRPLPRTPYSRRRRSGYRRHLRRWARPSRRAPALPPQVRTPLALHTHAAARQRHLVGCLSRVRNRSLGVHRTCLGRSLRHLDQRPAQASRRTARPFAAGVGADILYPAGNPARAAHRRAFCSRPRPGAHAAPTHARWQK